MKKPLAFAVLILLVVGISGCDFIGDVLEFGLWVILIGVVVVVLLIFALFKAFLN